jgi:hypothetical protein
LKISFLKENINIQQYFKIFFTFLSFPLLKNSLEEKFLGGGGGGEGKILTFKKII